MRSKIENKRTINVRITEDVYNLLTEYCDVIGQTKTLAIERSILAYCSPRLERAKQEESDV